MAVSEQFRDNLRRWQDWQARVGNPNTFSIPENYASSNAKGTYDRFTGFLKEWAFELFSSVNEGDSTSASIAERNFAESDFIFGVDSDEMDEWWKQAVNAGNGNTKSVDLLATMDSPTKEEKQAIYDTFLPAYRAIKESFNKRSVFQWIFNHAQYVAERDSLKALEGIIGTLTREGKQGLKNALATYQSHVPVSETEQAIANEEARLNREANKAPEVKDPEPEIKKGPNELKDFLQTGYRPNLEDVEREWNMIKPLYDAAKNGEIWGDKHNVSDLTVQEILSKNFIRLQLFKLKVEKEGGVNESAKALLGQMESIYAAEDADFRRNNPNYSVPEIPEAFIQEKNFIDNSNIADNGELEIDNTEIKKEIKVDYQKPTKSDDFLKIGYIPDINDIEHEWELIKPLYDAVNNDKLLTDRTVENVTAKEILFDNYGRLKMIRDEMKNSVESAAKLLESMKPVFMKGDATYIQYNPDYIAPEPSLEVRKQIKIEDFEPKHVEEVSPKHEDNTRAINAPSLDDPFSQI